MSHPETDVCTCGIGPTFWSHLHDEGCPCHTDPTLSYRCQQCLHPDQKGVCTCKPKLECDNCQSIKIILMDRNARIKSLEDALRYSRARGTTEGRMSMQLEMAKKEAEIHQLKMYLEDVKLRNHLLRRRLDLPIERIRQYDQIIARLEEIAHKKGVPDNAV